METTLNVNTNKLSEVAHKSPTAESIAKVLASRERMRHSIDITRTRTMMVRQGEKLVEQDYMQFWQDLEKLGVGSIIYGRRGKSDRFQWHYNLKQVGKALIGDAPTTAPARQIKRKPGRPKGTPNKLSAVKVLNKTIVPIKDSVTALNETVTLTISLDKKQLELLKSVLTQL